MELPVKVSCRTVDNKFFVTTPHFGHCKDGQINEAHVGQTIKLQERLLKNSHLYLKKSNDHYGLLSDPDFVKILTGMIASEHYMRPNVTEILGSEFILQ